MDDATRFAYAKVFPAEKGQTAAGVLAWSVRWFTTEGVATGQETGDNATR